MTKHQICHGKISMTIGAEFILEIQVQFGPRSGG